MKQNKKTTAFQTIVPVETPAIPLQTTAWYKKEWAYFALLFFIVSIIWSRLTNYTWDDDAVSRFINVQSANKNVYNFLDSWDRPLFSVLFYLPIKLFGRMGLAVMMSLLTSLSGCFLYKALAYKNEKRA